MPKTLKEAMQDVMKAGADEVHMNSRFLFDETDPATQRWVKAHAAELVSDITTDTRAALNLVIRDGIANNIDTKNIAKMVRSTIGLTERDTAAVMRLQLTQLERGVNANVATARAEKYARQLVNRRATTIAQTETMRAVNKGQALKWKQAQDAGVLSDYERKVWITYDPCDWCAGMSGEVVGIDEDFSIGDEPPLHPNCRCTIALFEGGEGGVSPSAVPGEWSSRLPSATDAEKKKLPPGLVKWLEQKRLAKEAGEVLPPKVKVPKAIKKIIAKPVGPLMPISELVDIPILDLKRPYYSTGGTPLEILPRPSLPLVEQTAKQRVMQEKADRWATKMGYDQNMMVVRDYGGRTFQLNGQTLTEGGHYSPMTGMIEVNASTVSSGPDGVIVHEIAHAQFDYVTARAADESSALSARWGLEQAPDFDGVRYMTKEGTVRADKLAEIRALVPHLDAMTNAGMGSRVFGINAELEALFTDDGVSSYSTSWWTNANIPSERNAISFVQGRAVEAGTKIQLAVNETMSEIARIKANFTESGDRYIAMTDNRFTKLRAKIKELYEKDPAAVKQFFAKKQSTRRQMEASLGRTLTVEDKIGY